MMPVHANSEPTLNLGVAQCLKYRSSIFLVASSLRDIKKYDIDFIFYMVSSVTNALFFNGTTN